MGFHFINKNKLILVLVTVFTAAMVLFPQVTEAGSKSAIIIWANSIVPVLLPFPAVLQKLVFLLLLSTLLPVLFQWMFSAFLRICLPFL